MTIKASAALLTRTSRSTWRYTVDASDLGWRPGEWPEEVLFVDDKGAGIGNGLRFFLRRCEIDGTHEYSQTLGIVSVRVFNA